MSKKKPCPTPTKHCHPTEDAAYAHLKSHRATLGGGRDLDVYRCVCACWHIGKSQAKLGERIRQSIRPVGRHRRRHTRKVKKKS
ncbi:MAG TPA: hypothetical protein VNB24_09045 [Acidimicrobiales bacterium]|nr:hypothetical protein [Acidimicrobiales bacterium]